MNAATKWYMIFLSGAQLIKTTSSHTISRQTTCRQKEEKNNNNMCEVFDVSHMSSRKGCCCCCCCNFKWIDGLTVGSALTCEHLFQSFIRLMNINQWICPGSPSREQKEKKKKRSVVFLFFTRAYMKQLITTLMNYFPFFLDFPFLFFFSFFPTDNQSYQLQYSP